MRLPLLGARGSSRVAWGMATLLVLSACTPASPTPTGGNPSPASAGQVATPGSQPATGSRTAAGSPAATSSEPAQPGGRVIVGSFADVKTLSPVLESDNVSASVVRRVYEPLLSVDNQSADLKPRLASAWEVSPDGMRVSFTLRDRITWSDGSPITGEDFAFTAQAVMRSQKTARKENFENIVGAKEFASGAAPSIAGIKVAGNSITVDLTEASCPALYNLGTFRIIPKSEFGKYIDPADATKNLDGAAENNAPKLASGPFAFKEWVPGDRLVLTRNDRFFLGKPNLDEYVNRVVPNATALAATMRTGEVDVSGALLPQDLEDLRRSDLLNVQTYLAPSYTFIGWNQLRGGKEFLQEKPVRQALAYGLNMQQVVDRVYFGEGQKMVSHTPPISWAAPQQGMNDYPFDPARAQSLLEQSGWAKGSDGVYAKNGQRLAFEIVTNSGNTARETLLQVAAEQYKQIGVDITPRTEAFEALVDRIQQSKDPKYGDQGGRDFDAIIIGWSLDAEPDPYAVWHSSQTGTGKFNFIGYKNPDLDQAIIDGRTRCALPDRKAAYDRFNKILNEEQPYNFGLAPKTILAANKKVQNVKPGPWPNREDGYLWNVHEWWIKQ